MSLLVFATVSLHGTPASDITSAARDVRTELLGLIEKMRVIIPTAERYSGEAYTRASFEYTAIHNLVCRVESELLWIADEAKRPFTAPEALIVLLKSAPDSFTRLPLVRDSQVDEFVEAAKGVFRSAGSAEEKMRKLAPNMRDYSSREDWLTARSQHFARVEAVRKVGGYYLLMGSELRRSLPVAA